MYTCLPKKVGVRRDYFSFNVLLFSTNNQRKENERKILMAFPVKLTFPKILHKVSVLKTLHDKGKIKKIKYCLSQLELL